MPGRAAATAMVVHQLGPAMIIAGLRLAAATTTIALAIAPVPVAAAGLVANGDDRRGDHSPAVAAAGCSGRHRRRLAAMWVVLERDAGPDGAGDQHRCGSRF